MKDYTGGPEKTQADSRTEGSSPKPDAGPPLPRTIFTQLIEHREVKMLFAWSLHSYFLVSLAQEGTLKATESEI